MSNSFYLQDTILFRCLKCWKKAQKLVTAVENADQQRRATTTAKTNEASGSCQDEPKHSRTQTRTNHHTPNHSLTLHHAPKHSCTHHHTPKHS